MDGRESIASVDAPSPSLVPPNKSPQQTRQVLLLLLSIIPEAILESTLIPLYPFIVKSQSPDLSDDDAGYRAGLLGSAFYGPLFIMNMVWGSASDKTGRKPILIAGIIVFLACATVLGFSTTYWLTFLCRFIAGVFGANSTVAKGMLGEIIRDDTGRAWGYAMYGSVYGVSGILGPLLAGILAEPSKHYSWLFGGSQFLESHPYSLPCFFGALLGIGGLWTTVYMLKEPEKAVGNVSGPGYTAISDEDGDEELADWSADNSFSSSISEPPAETLLPIGFKKADWRPEALGRFKVLGPRTFFVIVLYCTIALVNVMYMTALPLYLSASSTVGGLHLDVRPVATSMMVIALLKLAVQIGRFDLIIAYLGITNCFKLAMTLMIPTNLFVPFLGLAMPAASAGIPDPTLPSILPVIPIMALLGIAECMAYTSVIIMITQSVPASQMGLAHGVAGTCAAVMRTIGPALAGTLWAAGSKAHMPGLVFVANAVVSLVSVLAVVWGRAWLVPPQEGEVVG